MIDMELIADEACGAIKKELSIARLLRLQTQLRAGSWSYWSVRSLCLLTGSVLVDEPVVEDGTARGFSEALIAMWEGIDS